MLPRKAVPFARGGGGFLFPIVRSCLHPLGPGVRELFPPSCLPSRGLHSGRLGLAINVTGGGSPCWLP